MTLCWKEESCDQLLGMLFLLSTAVYGGRVGSAPAKRAASGILQRGRRVRMMGAKKQDRTGPTIRVLYVEDEGTTRKALARAITLKFPAVRLLLAENGRAGLEMFTAHAPDIILTDISLPEMGGLEMAAGIKALNPQARIIVLSAHSDLDYLLAAINLGVSRYILKPVDYKQLFSTIEDCAANVLLSRQIRSRDEHIRKLSRAVERSADVVVITDTSGAIEYVNPKFCEITGYTYDEAIGQNPRILKSGAMPPETYAALWKTIASGDEWRGEFRNRRKNGELYWERASISSITDEEGRITHYVAVKEDISARKRSEEEIEILNTILAARAAELEIANRELQAFNSMVSHDLKGPLTNICGYAQVFLEMYGGSLDAEAAGFLSCIVSETERMNGLIDTLLDFSRIDRMEGPLEAVNLSVIAERVAAQLRINEPHRPVQFTITPEMVVLGDVRLLQIALQNLIGNAWKYTSRTAAAVIEFGRKDEADRPIFFVRDNGAGFSMEQSHRLFQVFQRLHHPRDFEGHGIGLATVNRIIHRLGGKIWAEGEIDKGATFYFTLQHQPHLSP